MNNALVSLNRFFVASGRGGGWLIFREGLNRAVHALPRKITAVETARTLARDLAPSEVMVERGDGTFHLQYRFGTGAEELAH